MEVLVVSLIFASTVALVLGVATFVVQPAANRRLARLRGDGAAADEHSESMLVRDQNAMALLLQRLGNRSPQGSAETTGRLRERMIHAGYRGPSAPAIFLGVRVLMALSLPMLALLFPPAWSLTQIQLMLLLGSLVGIGYVAPSYWVDRKRAYRQLMIDRGLPDALDLMVVCVEAGFGINASLSRVADEFAQGNPILSSEFSLVVLETRAGKPTTEALRGLADRTGVGDISSLVALLVQTERFGTSVADALRVHADSMRVRRMQRAEERAQKAPLKLIFPTMLIFCGLLMIFLVPGMYMFSQSFKN